VDPIDATDKYDYGPGYLASAFRRSRKPSDPPKAVRRPLMRRGVGACDRRALVDEQAGDVVGVVFPGDAAPESNGRSVEDVLAMQTPAPDDALEVGPPVKPTKEAA
jgi:hypothetical protein